MPQKRPRVERISTGSYDLNTWLHGGYETDIITMLAGSPGTGKTNLCLLAACSRAKHGEKVIFIDTEGGFSVDRVRQIVGEGYSDILERILIMNPTSFSEQQASFEKLLSLLKNGHVGLVVIDGIAMLYRLALGAASSSGEDAAVREINREVAHQMRTLAEISRKQHIPILLTNQMYGSFLSEEQLSSGASREFHIVGGDLFKYWSKCIIELHSTSGKRQAKIIKHRSLPPSSLSFDIRDKGIFKRRLF